MRHLTMLGGVAALALAYCGCDAKTDKAVMQEVMRYGYVEGNSRWVVTSIVGASAPSGGPAALNALCTDQAWRMWVAREAPEFEHVPSMFELPDPNRPAKITTVRNR
jgi:hypothetical protein